jgi:hypothetical protein
LSTIERRNRLLEGTPHVPTKPASEQLVQRTEHRAIGHPNFSGDCTTTVASFCQT